MVVAERDQGLVTAAVVTLKVGPLKVGLDALRQDALQVFKGGFFGSVWLYVGVRRAASTELALLMVTHARARAACGQEPELCTSRATGRVS